MPSYSVYNIVYKRGADISNPRKSRRVFNLLKSALIKGIITVPPRLPRRLNTERDSSSISTANQTVARQRDSTSTMDSTMHTMRICIYDAVCNNLMADDSRERVTAATDLPRKSSLRGRRKGGGRGWRSKMKGHRARSNFRAECSKLRT